MALIVQRKAIQAISSMQSIITAIHKQDRSLADQLKRAASSVVLNIAEADGNAGGNARSRFATACGSAKEVRATLQLAAAWGYVSESVIIQIDADLDEVCAMTWRLSGR